MLSVFIIAKLKLFEDQVEHVFTNHLLVGVSDDLLAQARGISIPIDPRVESLNVSTAAAVCLFETMRVRRS